MLCAKPLDAVLAPPSLRSEREMRLVCAQAGQRESFLFGRAFCAYSFFSPKKYGVWRGDSMTSSLFANKWAKPILVVAKPIPYFRISANPGPRGGRSRGSRVVVVSEAVLVFILTRCEVVHRTCDDNVHKVNTC